MVQIPTSHVWLVLDCGSEINYGIHKLLTQVVGVCGVHGGCSLGAVWLASLGIRLCVCSLLGVEVVRFVGLLVGCKLPPSLLDVVVCFVEISWIIKRCLAG